MNRTQAVRKLQLSLKDFRRLCILKGIYPREPKRKSKAGNRTYYYTKDIMYLAHEPVINKFREFKIFMKRYSKAVGRGEKNTLKRLKASRPSYQLDHIVKERYPNFVDAMEDLDDALCLASLFATLPQTDKIPAHRTRNCRRLCDEFQSLVASSRALSKVFVSVKGVYYQARLFGKDVTWLVPHKFSQELPDEVDYAVMLTFLEFYEVLLHFVNLRLYKEAGLFYPPVLNRDREEAEGMSLSAVVLQKIGEAAPDKTGEGAAAANAPISDDDDVARNQENQQRAEDVMARLPAILAKDQAMDTAASDGDGVDESEPDEADATGEAANQDDALVFGTGPEEGGTAEQERAVFAGCVFFLAREVPRESLHLVIRNGGGQIVGGQAESEEGDLAEVTHHIADRSSQQHRFLSREYCQPQWVYDSFNAGLLLPCADYAIGVTPPAHLSPFVDNEKEGYVPQRAKEIARLVAASQGVQLDPDTDEDEDEDDNEDEDGVNREDTQTTTAQALARDQDDDGEDASVDEVGSDEDTSDEEEVDAGFEAGRGQAAAAAAVKQAEAAAKTEEEEQYEAELQAEKEGKPVEQPGAQRKRAKRQGSQDEDREMAIKMMSKRQKRLYDRAMFGKNRKSAEVDNLKNKAKAAKRARVKS